MAEKEKEKETKQGGGLAEETSKPTAEQPAEQPKPREKALDTLKRIKENVKEDDNAPIGSLTLRKILGGDILSAELVRRQIWLFVLVVLFCIVYVAFRYQCQQDMILIDKLEGELKDAKYKALSSSSTLTEKCRESRILDMLRANRDSVLKASDKPPYIIYVPEDE